MGSRHLSLRIPEDTWGLLEDQARRSRESVSELARRFIDEGLRMEAHPGIVFRPGPTGRRAALANGPDVWEIVQDFLDWDDRKHPADQTVGASSLFPHQIRQALRYYADFPREIDDRIKQNQDAAVQAYETWLKGQKLPAR